MEKLFFHGVDINEINEALSSPTKGSSKISSPVSSRHGLRPVTKPVLEQKAREDKHFPRFENRYFSPLLLFRFHIFYNHTDVVCSNVQYCL